MFYYFELIKVTVADGPVSVLPPPSQNCPKVTDTVTDFIFFLEIIREVLANTLHL